MLVLSTNFTRDSPPKVKKGSDREAMTGAPRARHREGAPPAPALSSYANRIADVCLKLTILVWTRSICIQGSRLATALPTCEPPSAAHLIRTASSILSDANAQSPRPCALQKMYGSVRWPKRKDADPRCSPLRVGAAAARNWNSPALRRYALKRRPLKTKSAEESCYSSRTIMRNWPTQLRALRVPERRACALDQHRHTG